MVENLKKGDRIVTSGGITGTISRVIDNDKIVVEIADNVTVEVIRGTGVQSLMNSQEVKK
jgi:preprotein translocase subunit YajC